MGRRYVDMNYRHVLMAGVACVALAPVPSLVVADEIPTQTQAGEPLECDLVGEVSGPGHRLVIPSGFTGCPGWHRVFMVPMVDLGEDRYILVSYNQAVVISLGSAEELANVGEYSSVERISHTSIKADGMPGERAVFTYKDSDEADTIYDTVLLTSTLPSKFLSDAPLFQLSLSLFTTPEHYETDRQVFDQLLDSAEQDAKAE